MVSIPFFTLGRQYKSIKSEIDKTLAATVRAGNFILGANVTAFEKEFTDYIHVRYGVGVGSGTDALTLALRSLDLTRRDEVLVPANSYPTVFGVAQSGVSVRLVDCGWDANISLTDLPKRITKRTRAIIVVHLYGNPANVQGVQDVLQRMKRRDITIIEDCAQAHGATIGKKKVGSFGDIACFSFYPTKNLGAYGDGGMVVTNHVRLADRVRRLRMYGEVSRYTSIEVSGVTRLDELQAAILRVKLRRLNQWNSKRRRLAAYYSVKLASVPNLTVLPYNKGSCHHLFVVRTKNREYLHKLLSDKNIGTAVHYPVPIHLIPAFQFLGYRRGEFPVAETLSREVLSLPFFPEMTKKEIDEVIRRLSGFARPTAVKIVASTHIA